MKLSEKGLRQLIKEELALVADVDEEEEGSEATRDAIESNLHDETIVRFFEEKGEGISQGDAATAAVTTVKKGISQGDAATAAVTTGKKETAGGGITPVEREIILTIKSNLAAIAKEKNIETGALGTIIDRLEAVIEKILGPSGPSAAIQEEIVSKVVEEIFKKKQ